MCYFKKKNNKKTKNKTKQNKQKTFTYFSKDFKA